MASGSRRPLVVLAWLGLVLAGLVAYASVVDNGFVSLDDPTYVTENAHVLRGWTAEGARWALGAFRAGIWHPLTWWSHMTDVALFGVDARAHHLVNVGLHVVNALLLFWWLRRVTGWFAASLVMAAVFLLHPLRVESVAWASERKDLLAGLFWMSTLLAYDAYARRPSWWRYALVFVSMAVGLMAKPMLVTLPMLLLVLDVWPWRRIGSAEHPVSRARIGRLVAEKIPLLALSVASSVVAVISQRSAGAMQSLESLSVTGRVSQAAISYVAYVGKIFAPHDLAVFYPHLRVRYDEQEMLVRALAALALLALLTFVAVRVRRVAPAVTVGWLWYLGTLVPVIGLVQVGNQAMADRYTYLPSIGLVLALVGGAVALLERRPRWRTPVAAAVVVTLGVLVVLTQRQVATWRSSETLFAHAVAVTEDNHVALSELGVVYLQTGRPQLAYERLSQALAINGDYAFAHHNMGSLLAGARRYDEARVHFERAVSLQPDAAPPRVGLGDVERWQGDLAAALEQYRRAADLDPEYRLARSRLGVCLSQMGRTDEARAEFERLLAERPDDVDTWYDLAANAVRAGDREGARAHFARVLDLDPSRARARFQLASLMIEDAEFAVAERELSRVIEQEPSVPDVHFRLGETLLAQGQDARAIEAFERVSELDGPRTRGPLAIAWVVATRDATSGDACERARRSLERALSIDAELRDDGGALLVPAGLEVRAAVLARCGDPLAAAALQAEALAQGRVLDAVGAKERLESYRAGSAWSR